MKAAKPGTLIMEQWLQDHLESEAGSMFQNDTLRLSSRRIQQLDWIPTNRYDIDLRGNHLKTLPDLHAYVRQLCVQNNNIRHLPHLPPRLMYLALDGNPLDELPYLPESLRVLNASSCQLVEVVELPRKLEYLTLNYNYLTSLPTLPDHLDTLEIHCNDIQELPFLPLSLRRLVIGDNPALKKYIGKSIAEIRHIICMRLAGERTYRIKGELTAALDKKLTKAQATESE